MTKTCKEKKISLHKNIDLIGGIVCRERDPIPFSWKCNKYMEKALSQNETQSKLVTF